MSEKSASLLGELSSELEKCRRLSVETPLVNPYQQLSYYAETDEGGGFAFCGT
ncbi:MAG: hypothetical protein GXP00_09000 [Alphaproteobacteria bacterium]|nr:hypothetical protein [Alphaproteobacteria bacterium]